MATALFNIRLLSELPLANALGRGFIGRGWNVAFCAEHDSGAAAAIQIAADCLGARFLNAEPAVRRHRDRLQASTPHRLRRRAERAVGRVIPAETFLAGDETIQGFIDEFAALLAASSDVLDDARPAVVIVGQDGMSGNPALIRAAQARGIPVVDCPYGFGTTRDFDDYIDEKAGERALKFAEGKFGDRIRRQHRQWIRRTRHGDVLMFPAEYILARERMQMTLPLPWVIHGGTADVLAAESAVMEKHYLQEGINPKKVKLTGTAYCDAMRKQLDAVPAAAVAFEASTKIQNGRTSVLVSLPPSLHGIRARLCEFDSYEKGCAAILAMVKRSGIDAVISLHPNAPAEQRGFVNGLGLEVSDEWVIDLIPRFDIFLTTFSSTIRWAIACGKPVLNYNMYGYNNHDYDGVAGVFTHARLQDVAAAFEQLIDDRRFATVAAEQKAAGAAWGIMDGRNFDRIHDVVSQL